MFVSVYRDRHFIGFYFVELVAAVSALVTYLLYRYFGIAYRTPFAQYASRLQNACLLYLCGLVVSLLVVRAWSLHVARREGVALPRRASWNLFRDLYLRVGDIVHDLRLIHAVTVIVLIFINLKHLIPLINPRVFDEAVARAEKFLFFGQLGTQRLIQLFGVTWAEELSWGYTAWYGYLACVVYLMVLQRSRSLSQQFCFAFSVTWVLGILIVYFIPTWGPCFSDPQSIAGLPHTGVSELQLSLWKNKLFLTDHPKSSLGIFAISGLPSLHLALTIVGSFYLMRLNTVAGQLSWLFAALTLVTTLYFGWHFVLDDILGVLLGITAVRLTDRIYSPQLLYVQDV